MTDIFFGYRETGSAEGFMSDTKTPPAAGMVLKRRERRGQGRVEHALTVHLVTDDVSTPLVTENVTRNGMFILTDTPARSRDIIEIEVNLGDDGMLNTLVVVRHVIRPEEGEPLGLAAGMGVQLYGLSASKHQRWEQFVRGVRQQADKAPIVTDGDRRGFSTPVGETHERYDRSGLPSIRLETNKGLEQPPKEPQASKRERRSVSASGAQEFAVRFPNIDVLRGFQNRDVALGGFFLITSSQLDVGTPIAVRVIHPETDEAFIFDCEVLRSGTEDRSGRAGLSVRFVDMSDEVLGYFDEFVRVGAVEVDIDIDIDLDDFFTDS